MLNAEAIRALKKHGTWLVPTLYQWWEPYDLPPELAAKNEYVKTRVGQSMRDVFKAGVKAALGTDAGAGPHGRSGREFTAYVEHGMAPWKRSGPGASTQRNYWAWMIAAASRPACWRTLSPCPATRWRTSG